MQPVPSSGLPADPSAYIPIPVFRLAEIANLVIGIGTFVGVALGSFVAGVVHIQWWWRVGVFVGIAGAAMMVFFAVRAATTRPRKRYLRSLALAFAAEIAGQARLVRQALADHYFWNPEEQFLPSYVWPRHIELAAEPRFTDAFYAVVTAYQEADRVNWYARHNPAAIVTDKTPAITEALTAFDAAYGALQAAVTALRLK